jgi:hypothetical protein
VASGPESSLPIEALQQTAAAMLVPRDIMALSAAAAAELGVRLQQQAVIRLWWKSGLLSDREGIGTKGMTPHDWLTGTDPGLMIAFLSKRGFGGRVSERSLTLFACACCRGLGPLIPTEPCWEAVEVAERYVDGLATDQERITAWSAAFASAEEEGVRLGDSYYSELIDWGQVPGGFAFRATMGLVGAGNVYAGQVARDAALEVAWDARRLRSGLDASELAFEETYDAEQMAQCRLLRDLFPNPSCKVIIDASWLLWNDGIVRSIAKVVYKEQAFDRLPILADALEEAGCANVDILSHCRNKGPHVKGCWVVDRLLDKR